VEGHAVEEIDAMDHTHKGKRADLPNEAALASAAHRRLLSLAAASTAASARWDDNKPFPEQLALLMQVVDTYDPTAVVFAEAGSGGGGEEATEVKEAAAEAAVVGLVQQCDRVLDQWMVHVSGTVHSIRKMLQLPPIQTAGSTDTQQELPAWAMLETQQALQDTPSTPANAEVLDQAKHGLCR
jgi:hypothetical protein